VDGHSIHDLVDALGIAMDEKRPSIVIAKTVKGKGVSFLEDVEGRHGKAISNEELAEARKEIRARMREADADSVERISVPAGNPDTRPVYRIETDYTKDDEVATRDAFGTALEKLGHQDERVIALDGDVKNSTRAKSFFGSFPDRSIECFISEMTMTGVAQGLAVEGYRPVAATFAAFWTRAHDQLRMAAYSDSDLTLAGSHTGVAIGEDGPSQMGLEDLAMMRSIYGSTVLSPCDAVSAEKLTAAAAQAAGVSYVRTIRGDSPIVYSNDEEFPIGGIKVLRSSTGDTTAIVATGTAVHEALEAASLLHKDGTSVTVVDCYSLKPIDKKALRRVAESVDRMITVEDHYYEGGLGEAVAGVVDIPVEILAVTKRPHSGDPDELLAEQAIDAEAIKSAVERA
jgi:transketolase